MQNKEIVKAWLDGAEIQSRLLGGEAWVDEDPYEEVGYVSFNFECFEYRVKSEVKTLTYRVALFEDEGETWTNTYDDQSDYSAVEESSYFSRWLTEEQTVEI